jgi:outer membrane protein assembly factor BamD
MTRLFFTLFSLLVVFSTPAHAIKLLWWKDRPVDKPPAVQTESARPIYQKALAAENNGRVRKALKLYEEIYQDYPASSFAGQSLFNSAILEYNRKKWKKSYSAFQTILIYHPDFPRYQFKIAIAQAEGDGIKFMFVFPSRAYNRSVEYFEQVVRNAPYSDHAPLALMNVALIHQREGETAMAIDALDRLINSYPSSLLADDAYLSLAETFADLVQGPEYDQGATREAISYFEDFLILFSNNQDIARAEQGLAQMEDVYARSKLVIGEYYFKHRRWYQAAEIFFNEAITIAPDSPAAESARGYIAQIENIRANHTPPKQQTPDQKKQKSFIRRLLQRIVS